MTHWTCFKYMEWFEYFSVRMWSHWVQCSAALKAMWKSQKGKRTAQQTCFLVDTQVSSSEVKWENTMLKIKVSSACTWSEWQINYFPSILLTRENFLPSAKSMSEQFYTCQTTSPKEKVQFNILVNMYIHFLTESCMTRRKHCCGDEKVQPVSFA